MLAHTIEFMKWDVRAIENLLPLSECTLQSTGATSAPVATQQHRHWHVGRASNGRCKCALCARRAPQATAMAPMLCYLGDTHKLVGSHCVPLPLLCALLVALLLDCYLASWWAKPRVASRLDCTEIVSSSFCWRRQKPTQKLVA